MLPAGALLCTIHMLLVCAALPLQSNESGQQMANDASSVVYLELASPQYDPAMREAEQDYQKFQLAETSTASPVPSPAHNQAIQNKLPITRSATGPDRPTDDLHITQTKETTPTSPTDVPIGVDQTKVHAVDTLSSNHKGKITSIDEFRASIRQLARAIRSRPAGEQSVTDMISDASRTGLITELFPRVSLRAGLKPGVLPGLVDTASSSAAMLAPITSTPGTLETTIKSVSFVQNLPSALSQIQAQLPNIIPDRPQLHPLHPVQTNTLPPVDIHQFANAMNQRPQSPQPSQPSLLELSTGDALRDDQETDLTYLKGIGQGLETLLSIFHAPDSQLQNKAMEMAGLLKNIDTLAGSELHGPSLGEGQNHHHHHHKHGMGSAPVVQFGDLSPRSLSLDPPGGAQYGSLRPIVPQSPGSELSWMLESATPKGYNKDEKPQKVKLDGAWESFKGFIKKGVKAMEARDSQGVPTAAKESPTDGFGGWPQPYWWTRPPNWMDEIPAWMQRLQLKKAGALHKAASFG